MTTKYFTQETVIEAEVTGITKTEERMKTISPHQNDNQAYVITLKRKMDGNTVYKKDYEMTIRTNDSDMVKELTVGCVVTVVVAK